MGIRPEIPPDAKQSNCWLLVLILQTLSFIGGLINVITAEVFIASTFILLIIDLILFWIVMYHIAYVRVTVRGDGIDINMGPWEWPLLRWFFSSQIRKEEIVLIERKQRQCLYDVCPRLYCCPINWCCCHKSYSAYWWPFCCNDINFCSCCNLYDGDSDSSDMIQINLTQSPTKFTSMCFKRCAPCGLCALCACCVYNRIAVSLKDESVWNEIQANSYPLGLMESNERSVLAPEATEGNTPV